MKHRTGYLFKRGDNWHIQWRINGKLFSKALRDENGQAIKNKREAEEARDKFMKPMAVADEAEALAAIAAKANALWTKLDGQADSIALSAAWSEYLASSKRPDTGPDTLLVYEGQFGQFRKWMAEHHPQATTLRDVTDAIAEQYAGYLNHGRLTANTYNKHVRVLRLVFRVLAKKARLVTNVWADVETKKLTTQNHRELTTEELRKVCADAAGELRLLFGLGVYTGLRLRDCTTLKWSEVDLVRGFIRRVPNKIARRPNAKAVVVPIHRSLRAMLEDTPPSKRSGLVLPETAAGYTGGGATKKKVINRIQEHFTACGVEIHEPGTGVDGKRAVVRVGFHSLRHSFASLCQMAGVPSVVVQSILGHSSPAMTAVYSHVDELAAARAVACLPALTTDDKPATAKASPESICAQLRAIAETLTPTNLGDKRAELLALLTA